MTVQIDDLAADAMAAEAAARAEIIAEAFNEQHHEFASRTALGGMMGEAAEQWVRLEHLNDPQGLYARLPFDLGLK